MEGVASVGEAINDIQSEDSGFSIVSWMTLGIAESGQHDHNRAIRPQRPMLLPWWFNHHILLLVFQRDEDGTIGLHVLDSKKWHNSAQERVQIYQESTTVMENLMWYRIPFNDSQYIKPRNAIWVGPVAQQLVDWVCGYHTILNAWVIALGLNLNPDFIPETKFYEEARRLIIFALGGFLDYRIVYAFLLCRKFIQEQSSVPQDRRFEQTKKQTETGENEKKIRLEEDEMFMTHSGFQVNRSNNVQFESGVPHNTLFIGDTYTDKIRFEMIPGLAARGQFDESEDGIAVIQRFRKIFKRRNKSGSDGYGDDELEVMTKVLSQEGRLDGSETPRTIRGTYVSLYCPRSPKVDHDLEEIRKDPCSFYRQSLREAWDRFQEFEPRMEPKGRAHMITQMGEYLNDDNVLLGIASVIEAIMAHQEEKPYVSGFTLTSAVDLAVVRNYIDDMQEPVTVTRPRRPWLLPWVVDSFEIAAKEGLKPKPKPKSKSKIKPVGAPEEGEYPGHILLIVFQDGANNESSVHFLDSCPDYLKDQYDEIFKTVCRVAEKLRWNDHQARVKFPKSPETVDVARQRNHTDCGLHTIFNAWVCALGLEVNPDARCMPGFYNDGRLLVQCALASCSIDWKTIVAFLLCHKYIEGSIDDVPIDRRFPSTRRQTSDSALQMRNMDRKIGDLEAESLMAPLSTSNNINFDQWRLRSEEDSGDSENYSEEDSENGSEDDGGGRDAGKI